MFVSSLFKNSKININSFQNVNKSKSEEKIAISNTKRKLKNGVLIIKLDILRFKP